MLSAKELRATNAKICMTNIKGKMYADVSEKVKAYRRIIPGGRISTDIIHFDNNTAIIKATVADANGLVLGTGTAYEAKDAKGSMVNKTSYLENCETSAVGRALSHCGLGLNLGIEMKLEGTLAENLDLVNKTIRPVDVRGKSYAEVRERIAAFRKLYPNGSIITELVANDDTFAMFKTTVYDENGSILATGVASEESTQSGVNSNNFIENAETSSLGRALGFAGFGIDADICSADEIESAYIQQEAMRPVNADEINAITDLSAKAGVSVEKLLEAAKVESLEELTYASYEKLVRKLNKTIDTNKSKAATSKPAQASSKLMAAAAAYKAEQPTQ